MKARRLPGLHLCGVNVGVVAVQPCRGALAVRRSAIKRQTNQRRVAADRKWSAAASTTCRCDDDVRHLSNDPPLTAGQPWSTGIQRPLRSARGFVETKPWATTLVGPDVDLSGSGRRVWACVWGPERGSSVGRTIGRICAAAKRFLPGIFRPWSLLPHGSRKYQDYL